MGRVCIPMGGLGNVGYIRLGGKYLKVLRRKALGARGRCIEVYRWVVLFDVVWYDLCVICPTGRAHTEVLEQRGS